MKIITGTIVTPDARIAIAIARFNHFINDKLLDGAVDTLERIGQVKKENITVVWVPGSYELPLIVKILAESQKYDAIISLGTIIRGRTTHFECIVRECSAGLSTVAMNTTIPVTFGLLTVENVEQAIERAGVKVGNKGTEAALVALEMINILRQLRK